MNEISKGRLYYAEAPGRNRYAKFFFLGCVLLLNIATVMSLAGHIVRQESINWASEAVQFLFNIAFTVYMVPTLLLECQSVEVTEHGVNLRVLLWKSRLGFSEVELFQVFRFFTWSILRTSRCFYLINRRDLANFDQLMLILCTRVPFQAPGGNQDH